MFAIIGSGVYDAVESIHGCFGFGTMYCKYGDKPYHIIDNDEERIYLLNHFYEVHEIIHVMDEDQIEIIVHDRLNDYFKSYEIDGKTFPTDKMFAYMKEIDELYQEHSDKLDDWVDDIVLSNKLINLFYKNSYTLGEYA